MVEWALQDNRAADKEGWAIFNGPNAPEIQRIDETAVFPDDDTAWLHVVTRALEGSDLHRRALLHIQEKNEDEWRYLSTLHPRVVELSELQTSLPVPDN